MGNKTKTIRGEEMSDPLNKIFVNCNKIKEQTAKRILKSGKDLSIKDWEWDIPLDLMKISKVDINRDETFIGVGRWNSDTERKRTKFICISQKGELVYLEPEIVKIMYNSIKIEQKLSENKK